MRINTKKVRTNTERVRLVQEDLTNTLVAEILANKTRFHACIR